MNIDHYGGPAFPVLLHSEGDEGMSLRDYFAAKALATLIDRNDTTDGQNFLAALAYDYADAMLKARKR